MAMAMEMSEGSIHDENALRERVSRERGERRVPLGFACLPSTLGAVNRRAQAMPRSRGRQDAGEARTSVVGQRLRKCRSHGSRENRNEADPRLVPVFRGIMPIPRAPSRLDFGGDCGWRHPKIRSGNGTRVKAESARRGRLRRIPRRHVWRSFNPRGSEIGAPSRTRDPERGRCSSGVWIVTIAGGWLALGIARNLTRSITMPSVRGIPGPYHFLFYSFDCNEPRHVHVRRERMICKYWLEPVALENSNGFSAKELNRIRRLIVE